MSVCVSTGCENAGISGTLAAGRSDACVDRSVEAWLVKLQLVVLYSTPRLHQRWPHARPQLLHAGSLLNLKSLANLPTKPEFDTTSEIAHFN